MKKLLLLLLLFVGCTEKTIQPKFDPIVFQSIDSLAALYNRIPESNDTIFMGFRLGMNKSEFQRHLGKLMNDGHDITINLHPSRMTEGVNHILNTPAVFGDHTGNSQVAIVPTYAKSGKMVRLSLYEYTDWNDKRTLLENRNWLNKELNRKYNYFDLKSEYPRSYNSEFSEALEELLSESPNYLINARRISKTALVYEQHLGAELIYASYKNTIAQMLIELQIKITAKEEANEITL